MSPLLRIRFDENIYSIMSDMVPAAIWRGAVSVAASALSSRSSSPPRGAGQASSALEPRLPSNSWTQYLLKDCRDPIPLWP
eukprot:6214560-Pleurochrysis_carterae.AAC.1